MSTSNVTVDVDTDAGSMEALAAGINARSEALKRVTSDSITAAGITILRSLKAATKKAPTKRVPADSYVITETNLVGGVHKVKGVWKIYCHARGDRTPSPIRPAMGSAPGVSKLASVVYKITPKNPEHMNFKKNVNTPEKCWYVLCATADQAVSYAERVMLRVLKNESGMAKAALGMAQAKMSTQTKSRLVTKEQFQGSGGMSVRAAGIAYDAGVFTLNETGYSSGSVVLDFIDNLNYSMKASGGESSMSQAIAKAANSMLGAYGSEELKQALSDYRITNPDAKFVDLFKRKFNAV